MASRGENLRILQVRWTTVGTPRFLLNPAFRVTASDLGLTGGPDARLLADAFTERYASIWRVPASAFADARVEVAAEPPDLVTGDVETVVYEQRHVGIPVVGGRLKVIVRPVDASVVGVVGSFAPVGDVALEPGVSAVAAQAAVVHEADEEPGEPRLVVWSGHMSGDARPPTLAWEVPVGGRPGGEARRVWLDAADGHEIVSTPVARALRQRSLWDRQNITNSYGPYSYLTCTNWIPYPPATCPWCAALPPEKCACPLPADDPNCPTNILRYDESSGCGSCGAEAAQLWADADRAYNYWAGFGRDSWDGLGDWMMVAVREVVNPNWVGITSPSDTNGDGAWDVVEVSIVNEHAEINLDGHELGHMLQFGCEGPPGSSFWEQNYDVNEHLADAHSFRYQGQEISLGYGCAGGSGDFRHYTQYATLDPEWNNNKFIGDCSGWLMHQHQIDVDSNPANGYQYTLYGVTVTSTTTDAYDKIWYRALKLYTTALTDLFDWWENVRQAAYDLYGFSDTYWAVADAVEAVGRWSPFSPIGQTGVRQEDRIPAVAWSGASRGPCVFYRKPTSTTQIYWRCYTTTGWTSEANFNSVSVDPAASEPAAAFRYVSPKNYVYVLWRGTDNRIWYRTLDVDTLAISGAANLGASKLTSAVPAAAPIYESGPLDRLIIVFHGVGANANKFFYTYVGDPNPAALMASGFDSDVPPSMTAYPYYDRIYFFRADPNSGATPRHLKYASYTMAGGWSGLTDLTDAYNGMGGVAKNVVRTDRGLSMAEYGLGATTRLNFAFVTLPMPTTRELWHGALRETSPGVLATDGYRAVPLFPVSSGTSQAAGGLAEGVDGTFLWHIWRPATLSTWRKSSE